MSFILQTVEANGLDSVGVYRVPGNTASVNALTTLLEQHDIEAIDFESDTRWHDVNVVSSLLKAFFRKLPEPLLTDKLYPFFIDAIRIQTHEARLRKLKTLIRKLPKYHAETLKYLIVHLQTVTKHSHVNKVYLN